jgi:LysM repeat protein
LPVAKIGTFVSNEKIIYDQVKADSLSMPIVAKEIRKTHTVKQGEHLNTIANRYKCTVSDIMAWNGLKTYKLKTGQKLAIYIAAPGSTTNNTVIVNNTPKTTAPDNTKTVSSNTKQSFIYHTIKNGDSLWNISQRYKTTIDEIKRLNNFGTNPVLLPGKTIIVKENKG